MKMRHLALILLSIFTMYSCKNDTSEKIDNSEDSLVSENIKTKLEKSTINENILYVFGDSVLLYENPSEDSKVIETKTWFDTLRLNQTYNLNERNLSNWICVNSQSNDSLWVYIYDITFKKDIEIKGNHKIARQHSLGDYGGITYISTSILKTKQLFKLGYIINNKGKWINDSLYLFHTYKNYSDRNLNNWPFSYIYLFDKSSDSLIFVSTGRNPLLENEKEIIFLKDHDINRQWINCNLSNYNILTSEIKVIYTEDTDTLRPCCFSDDGGHCSEIKITSNDTNEFYSFKLYRSLDHIQKYDMYQEVDLTVDKFGNIVNKKIEEIR